MNDELVRIGNEVAVVYFKVHVSTCPEKLRKTKRTIDLWAGN
jgi:hypothetical protein